MGFTQGVRLSLNQAHLPYTRELRCSEDVHIRFIPNSTGVEVVHKRGHIFLLTDLFLVCERMATEDLADSEANMWLCYPPLAAKHLRVIAVDGKSPADSLCTSSRDKSQMTPWKSRFLSEKSCLYKQSLQQNEMRC